MIVAVRALAAESYRQGSIDSLASLRDAVERLGAVHMAPMTTADVLALIDVAIDAVQHVNNNEIYRQPPEETNNTTQQQGITDANPR